MAVAAVCRTFSMRRADRFVLLVARQLPVEDVLVADLLAPDDAAAFVDPDLEARARLSEVFDLDVELPPLVLELLVQADDHSSCLSKTLVTNTIV